MQTMPSKADATPSATLWPPYAVLLPLGAPSSARDSESNEKVAIKKISGCFESPVDAKRMLREVKLLSHLRHENVIGLRDLLPPPSPSAAAYKVRQLCYCCCCWPQCCCISSFQLAAELGASSDPECVLRWQQTAAAGKGS